MAHTNNSIVKDTLERLAELGQHTAKETVKEVNKAFNPFASVLEAKQSPYQKEMDKQAKAQQEKLQQKKSDHTPLDFGKLENSYKNQDMSQLTEKRQYLERVQSNTERAQAELEQEREERKKKMEMEEEEKKRQEHAQYMQMMQGDGDAHGKAKGVLGKARPKAQVDYTPENKASKPKG